MTANGQLISLDRVATFSPRLEYSQLRRENQERQITESANSSSLSAQDLLDFVQPTLDGLDLGPDYTLRIDGETKSSGKVNANLGAGKPIALMIQMCEILKNLRIYWSLQMKQIKLLCSIRQ